ncbi:MAG: hypothetical protein COY40_00695 [Alphaproteobacteria bacterium CG_4_10_14_0_8_um_filter_53_9]|nr:MAG: hypothetical protein COY40_00695 [Alphaproteobacteria bacterium CG_4_10_14_0_8_um_filter_53_9]
MSTRWTAEEEALLTAAYRGGLDVKTIAETHNRSEGAIQARLHKLDLIDYGPLTILIADDHPLDTAQEENPETLPNTGTPWSDEDVNNLTKMFEKDPTPEGLIKLAPLLGRTPRSLALKLVHTGVITPKPNPNPQPRAQAPKAASLKTKALTPPTAPTKLIKIQVTSEFQTAAHSVAAGENLLILGSAGTGKSTFLKWLRKQLEGKKKYAVLAPTGMAALNVGGQTIHSFFGLKPELITSSNSWRKPRNPKMFKALDLLIIDEVSMVRADVFSAMDAFLRTFGPSDNKPFGGVQIVLMGDLCQLPPIVRRDEMDTFSSVFDSPFFFSTPTWHQGHFHTLQFTHIFRQEDEPFINLLTQIRHGESGHALLEKLNARTLQTAEAGTITLAARNATVDKINQTELAKLSGPSRTYTARVAGTAEPSAFTTPVDLVLKEGARVMFTKNDPDMRWVNGSQGVVTRLGEKDVTVRLSSGEEYVVDPAKWESIRYEMDSTSEAPTASVSGSFTQIPLTLAWALTIHKSQGQTLEKCVLDLSDGGTFAEGQLYVALSRAKSLEGITLTTPIRPNHIKTHPAVMAFYNSLNNHQH